MSGLRVPVLIGQITRFIINILGLEISPSAVLWGDSNRAHVKANHPATCQKYGEDLESVIRSVIENPHYVGFRHGAIEYVKTMPDGEILKAAVRASKKNVYFVRTVYPLRQEELDRFLAMKTIKKVG
ncbi:MAG: hypothetical protein LBO21_05645 [Synergistaceae bacterium]|nr:hypothetical protein [Synergistaceae bacterium]